jgi:hypothetical protein
VTKKRTCAYLVGYGMLNDDPIENITKLSKISISTDDVVFCVRSKVKSVTIGDRRSKIELDGRFRIFWFLGQTRIQAGDNVELYYQLIPVKSYKQAWVTKVKKIIISPLPSLNIINQDSNDIN